MTHESLPGLPRVLIGMIHLLPLPGSPRWGGSLEAVVERAVADARALESGGFHACLVENFGDAPFSPGRADPASVAAITAAAIEVRRAVRLPVGINVLKNDAPAARFPLVILVNRYTASASEVVAGALRDHQLATLIGSRTFGKGLVQNSFDLSDGSVLKLTTSRWQTPDGEEVSAKSDKEPGGLAPVHLVEMTAEEEGALLRLRPKVMTVSTVVASLLPIMWSESTGAEVMKPIATPVLGGMVSSLALVLIVTPVIFSWLRERELRRAEREARVGVPLGKPHPAGAE